MSGRLWSVSDEGAIEYRSLTSETFEGGLDAMRKSFFLYESVTKGVELSRDPNAAKELEGLCLRAALDGVSLAAINKNTGQVVGVCFNKIQVKASGNNESYFVQYASQCKCPSSRALVLFMNDADAIVDLFELTNADCLLEIMFLSVLPEWGQRGIGSKLCEISLELARALKAGENVKTPFNDKELSLTPVPKAVCSLFTSTISQKIGEALNFVTAATANYEKYTFEGKSFASRLGPSEPNSTVSYKIV